MAQGLQTQYLAKVDDTTQQQNSTLEGEREQHSSEFEEMQRYACCVQAKQLVCHKLSSPYGFPASVNTSA